MQELLSITANAATVIAAVLALVFGLYPYWRSGQIRDMEYLSNQREQIGEHWRRLMEAIHTSSGMAKFEFGEMLDCYERTCFTLNRKMVGRKTTQFMRAHVLEVLVSLISDDDRFNDMRALATEPRTYEEIRKLCLNNLDYVEGIFSTDCASETAILMQRFKQRLEALLSTPPSLPV